MPRKKVGIPSNCLKCGATIKEMEIQCVDCKSKKCSGCTSTENVVHQHLYNKDWYCIKCAKEINSISTSGKKLPFDLF